MEAYLDNSATTRCYEEVKDIVVKTMTEDFGNPSAMHLKGVEAENYVKEAEKEIAKTLKVQEKEIFFTSGGTLSSICAPSRPISYKVLIIISSAWVFVFILNFFHFMANSPVDI